MTPTEREALERRAANLQTELDKLKADLATPPRRGLVATGATIRLGSEAWSRAYVPGNGFGVADLARADAECREMVARCLAEHTDRNGYLLLGDGDLLHPSFVRSLRALFGLDEGGR